VGGSGDSGGGGGSGGCSGAGSIGDWRGTAAQQRRRESGGGVRQQRQLSHQVRSVGSGATLAAASVGSQADAVAVPMAVVAGHARFDCELILFNADLRRIYVMARAWHVLGSSCGIFCRRRRRY
jgi:hypothetical protein